MSDTQISRRTPEETLERVKSLKDDFFGKRREVLLLSLPLDAVRPFLNDDFDGEWTPTDPMAEAADYLSSAVEKMKGERGLSATRSVDAFLEYVWLLTDDATAAQYEATDYGWYGKTQLRFAAQHLGLTHLWNELTGETIEVLS